jgi:hypothetical protein
MFNNIKATLMKYCELSWESLTQLKKAIAVSRSFNNFDATTFNSPSVRVAVAVNEQGTPIAWCPVETIMVARAFAVVPGTSPEDAQRAGDAIDAEIAAVAAAKGITRLLLVVDANHPGMGGDEWRGLKVFERQIPNLTSENQTMGRLTPHPEIYIN